MDDQLKVEKWTLEDGRRAERRVTEVKDGNGQGERVIELHVEDARPLRLQQRIVEKTKPFIFERKLEVIDPATGNVIEQKVESLEPRVPMQVVEHIAVVNNGDYDNIPFTKRELVEMLAEFKTNNKPKEKQEGKAKDANPKVEAPKKVRSLGLAEEFEKMSVPQNDGSSIMDKFLICVIGAQVVGLAYIIFFM